jgi:hypothetical protein
MLSQSCSGRTLHRITCGMLVNCNYCKLVYSTVTPVSLLAAHATLQYTGCHQLVLASVVLTVINCNIIAAVVCVCTGVVARTESIP